MIVWEPAGPAYVTEQEEAEEFTGERVHLPLVGEKISVLEEVVKLTVPPGL